MGETFEAAVPRRRESTLSEGPIGDSASRESLNRLRREMAALKATKAALPYVKKALTLLGERKFKDAMVAAEKAAKHDPGLIHAWHLLGIAREHLGDRRGALAAYEKGLEISPESPPIANDLGRLAFRMGMLPQAETLFRHYLSHKPDSPEGANNLGALLRQQMRFDDAIGVLRPALQANPENAMLWITLGTVVGDMGQTDEAALFYSEALRLAPSQAKARYNLANALFTQGHRTEAIEHCRRAIVDAESPEDLSMMRFALGTMLLASGDLPQGWEAYAARLDRTFSDPIAFVTNTRRWSPGEDIVGRHLLLVGEQGLGDEVLFANILDDVLAALGPEGRLTLAVTERLVTLFQRSYPQIRIGRHGTLKFTGDNRNIRSMPFIDDWADIDMWAPMAEPLRQFRLSHADYPHRPEGFLRADPARVEHWRGELAALPGLKVGLLWTSMVVDTNRHRFFSPFEDWAPVLTTPGASFVNLQYGDQTQALERARREFGVEIYQPQGIDLKNDLDDVAALSCAMDLVVGISNATFNIAAACGAPAWLITTQEAWPRLGAENYPWYSQARPFAATGFKNWRPVMQEVADALADLAKDGTRIAAAG